ncbi:MAG: UvrD-helicase domain-containing protein, partial [Brevundimonas sp.]|uniref:carboxypeptidase regulatory-like domain-containing protein n=1 Tax=Brevundimonas sp. TaxID=1871086 RepID=UPI002733FB9A
MKLSLFIGAAVAPLVIALATPALAEPVTGTVVDASGTRALQGAEVTIVELGQTAIVGADGSFRFGDVPAGSYTLRARFAGAVDDVRTIVVPEATRLDQMRASDPGSSAWVSANAGSGKTHVLAQRVIRLLLDGTEPSKILCLTYTKAA